LRDIKSTYAETEFTGKGIKGISPYLRANFVRGAKPTYQVGISFKPIDLIKSFSRRKKK